MPVRIYLFTYTIYRYIIKMFTSSELEIHYRNSLAFGNIKFLHSDIDITFYAKNRSELERAYYIHTILKKIIPIIGEVNCYVSTEWRTISHFANRYEINRDPFLTKVSCPPKEVDSYEAFVFIKNMLLANKNQLKRASELYRRRNKWNYYLTNIGCPKIEIERETTLDDLNKHLANYFIDLNSNLDWKFIFDRISKNESILDTPWISPTNWLLEIFQKTNDEQEEMYSIIEEQTSAQDLLFIANLKWELVGLYSQITQSPFSDSFLEHIDNVSKALSHVRNESKNELSVSLQQLKAFIEF